MTIGPRRIPGRPAPLFDRLGAGERGRAEAPAHDLATLAASVERSLADLLATRTGTTAGAAAATVLGYGVPDPLNYPPADPLARAALAAAIHGAITRFEPRLAVAAVTVDADPNRAGAAICRITGELRHGRVTERVAFHLDLEPPAAEPAVDAS